MPSDAITSEASFFYSQTRFCHEYREIMKTNECTGWSRIIKTIYLKNRKRLEGGKRYTAKDDVYLRLAEDFLYRELAAALNVNREDVESIISDRVKQLS